MRTFVGPFGATFFSAAFVVGLVAVAGAQQPLRVASPDEGGGLVGQGVLNPDAVQLR